MLLVLHPVPRVTLAAVRFLRSYLRVSCTDKVEYLWDWSMRILIFRFICSLLQEKLDEISVVFSSKVHQEELTLSFSLERDDDAQSAEDVYLLRSLRDNILGCLSFLIERDASKLLTFLFSSLYERLLYATSNLNSQSSPNVINVCWLDEFFSWDFQTFPCIYGTTKHPFECDSNLMIILDALEAMFVFISNRLKRLKNLDNNQNLSRFYERVYELCFQNAVSMQTYPILFLNIMKILECCLSTGLLMSSKFSNYVVTFLSRLLEEIGTCSYHGATMQLVLCRTNCCGILVQLVKIPETAKQVVPYIGEFTSQVQSLVANGNLTMNEQNLLAESIIVLSTALQNLQEQRTFIEGMLSSAVNELRSSTWLERIQNWNAFMESFIWNGHIVETTEGETVERRKKFSRLISLLDSVSRGAREHSKFSESHHPFSYNIFTQLLEPLESKGVGDILYPSARESCHLLGFTEEMGLNPNDVLRRHGVVWPHPERDEIRFWLNDILKRCYNLAGDIIRGIGEYERNLSNYIGLMNALSGCSSDFDFRGLQLLLQHALRPLFSGFVPRSILERLADTHFFLLFEHVKQRLDAILGLEVRKNVSEEPEFNEVIRDACVHNTAKELFLVISDIHITHSRCQSSFSKESNEWKIGYSNVSTKYYSIHDPLPVITERVSLYSIIFSLICRFITWNSAYIQKKGKSLVEKLISVEMPAPAKHYFMECLLYNLFYMTTQPSVDSERNEIALELFRQLLIKSSDQFILQVQILFPNIQIESIKAWVIKESNVLKVPKKGKQAIRQMLKEHFQIVVDEVTTRGRNKIPSLPDKVQFHRIKARQLLEEDDDVDDNILSFCSPSRQALLKQWGYEFETESANIDEKSIRAETAEELVQKLAVAKSDAILARRTTQFENQKTTLLVTADQVVVHEGRILEKPKDANEAREFISGYSCSPAVTVGAIVVTNCQSYQRECGLDRSEVYFHPIPDSVIQQLVEEGSVYYCAGGLQVENPLVSKFVDHIVGTLDSVMGLSRQVLEKLIEKIL
ncbi:Maf-like protein DDB_G0281937 [Galdieria sulphuraria]|nr:Maf-like protein DDB_G0281937 [Galdieria sulphuraria]